ncbi:MAG TPA: cation:proton antiporter [Planctomycetota bacterium]|nr:cation:proton antiporter [Planctomycetota bacterium]
MAAESALPAVASAVPEIFSHPLPLFIIQATVIILFSRLIGWVARLFGQPMVIAEVTAGILLGPSLFGWLWPQAHLAIFPAVSHAPSSSLALVSQIGLIFFMFLIGLELDPKLLKNRGRASVVISHTSIIVPFVLGALLSVHLYDKVAEPGKPPVDFTSFLLFLGIAMSITAFPVLARILAERQLLKSHLGAVTITCAAVDDVTAWCLLAFVTAIVKSTGVMGAVWTTVLALAYIGFMLIVLRRFMQRMGASATNRSGVTQNLVAITFILLLASAFATEWIGIHALFGAFLFGAIMPREGGYVKVLADKLEDFVVVFLLPLFFAYSGLRTEVGLLNTGEDWWLCFLIVSVACLGKFGGSAIAARLTGLKWREASALGVLMNTRGLMELVVLNIGFDLGVISPKLFTMMVIMALVTTFLTTPLLHLIYPRRELADELAEPAPVVALPKPAFSMLMCVAQERSGPGMATLAAGFRGDDPEHARFYALRLIRPPERSSAFVEDAGEAEGGNALIPLLHRSEELDLEVKPISFVSTEPAEDICSVADAKKIDLVLLGWHRPIFSQSALGGVVYDVMQQAHTDVGVLVDRGLTKVERVLFAFNEVGQDRSALRLIRRLIERNRAKVTVLHVIPPSRSTEDPRRGVQEGLASAFESPAGNPSQVTVKLVESEDPPAAALDEARQGYDLVVLSLGAEWGLAQRRFGLHPEQIIQECPVSLLIVQPYLGLKPFPADGSAVTSSPAPVTA